MKISIPKMDRWEQIGGDMNPGAHGGTIARSDGDALVLHKIQPVRDYVGDDEAAEVGHPFWSREGWYDLEDLSLDRDDVQSALESIGMDEDQLEEYTPTVRALIIAEALMDYGVAEEGAAGWAEDVVPDEVKWQDGTVAGPEYFDSEEADFARDVLLANYTMDVEEFGPDEHAPTWGMRVSYDGRDVEITEWNDIEHATGEDQPEGAKVLRVDTLCDLDELLDPDAKHRGLHKDDERDVSIVTLAKMSDEDREAAIWAAASSYIAKHGGEDELVAEVGD